MTQCSDWQGKAMIGLGSDKLMEKISYSIGDQAGKITSHDQPEQHCF